MDLGVLLLVEVLVDLLQQAVHLEQAVEQQELQDPEDAERDDVGHQQQGGLLEVGQVQVLGAAESLAP